MIWRSTPASYRRALACRELVEVVTDYLEGALPPAERRLLEAHLAVCPSCVRYIEQLRGLVRLSRTLGRRLDARALAPDSRDALHEAFRGFCIRRHGA